MKTIQLTGGKVALVDEEDFEWLSQWKWSALKPDTHSWYAVRTLSRSAGSKMIYMHRQILEVAYCVDHVNGDGLDNRRSNLRPATDSQNGMNQRAQVGRSSKFKGVCRQGNKWRAYIKVNGKQIHIGRFHEERDAAAAYDLRAFELFGEFARTNKMEGLL